MMTSLVTVIRGVHPPLVGRGSLDMSMDMNEGRRQRVWAKNSFKNIKFTMFYQVNDHPP